MKTTLFLTMCAISFALGTMAQSQAPAAAQTQIQRLEAIRTKNKQLIEQQTETLKRLDELQLQAQQIKMLGKRT